MSKANFKRWVFNLFRKLVMPEMVESAMWLDQTQEKESTLSEFICSHGVTQLIVSE